MSHNAQRNFIWIIPLRGQRKKCKSTLHDPSNSSDLTISPPVTDVTHPFSLFQHFNVIISSNCTRFSKFSFPFCRPLASLWEWSLTGETKLCPESVTSFLCRKASLPWPLMYYDSGQVDEFSVYALIHKVCI